MYTCEGYSVGSGSQLNHYRNWYDCLTPLSDAVSHTDITLDTVATADMYSHVSTTLKLPQAPDDAIFVQHACELFSTWTMQELIDTRNREFDHVLQSCYFVH